MRAVRLASFAARRKARPTLAAVVHAVLHRADDVGIDDGDVADVRARDDLTAARFAGFEFRLSGTLVPRCIPSPALRRVRFAPFDVPSPWAELRRFQRQPVIEPEISKTPHQAPTNIEASDGRSDVVREPPSATLPKLLGRRHIGQVRYRCLVRTTWVVLGVGTCSVHR
jgi:hypothetical protein